MNAEVDDAVSTYENALDEEERENSRKNAGRAEKLSPGKPRRAERFYPCAQPPDSAQKTGSGGKEGTAEKDASEPPRDAESP